MGEVQGFSTSNLRADGTIFQVSREWTTELPNDQLSLSIGGMDNQVSIAILRPLDFDRHAARVQIRFNSVEEPESIYTFTRENPHNGTNTFSFERDALAAHKGQRAFFVAIDRDARVWRAVPLDLSMIDRGAQVLAMSDVELLGMRSDFHRRCISKATAQKLFGP